MSWVRRSGAFFVIAALAASWVHVSAASESSMASGRPVTPDECINVGLAFYSEKFDLYASLTGVIGVVLATEPADLGNMTRNVAPGLFEEGEEVAVAAAVFIVPKECEGGVTLKAVVQPPDPRQFDPTYVSPEHGLLP